MSSTTTRSEQSTSLSALNRVVAASLIGSVIEWYDYIVYGTLAALLFNKLFFPDFAPAVGTILAFATFAVGFLSRPLGAAIYGHFGDKMGRKSALVSTLLLMGMATTGFGLLPTYAQVGVWAPIGLVILRFVQGVAIGGEWGGATLLTMEYAPAGRRGFYSSLPQIGVPAGLLLSTVTIAVMDGILSDASFESWGWRVPFLMSTLLVVVGLFIRLRLEETPAFSAVQASGDKARYPVLEVVRSHPRQLLIAMGTRVANNAQFFLMTVFVVSYGTSELALDGGQLLTGVLVGSTIGLASIPAYGAISDRVGRRPVLMFGAAAMAILAFPMFWLLESGSTILIVVAIIAGLNIGHDSQYATQAVYICELFPAKLRYSGISLAYQIPSIFIGGLAPIVASSLVLWTGGASWAVALYVVFLAVVTLLVVFFGPETRSSTAGHGSADVDDTKVGSL